MIDLARASTPLLLLSLSGCFLMRQQNGTPSPNAPASGNEGSSTAGGPTSGSSGDAGRSGASGAASPSDRRAEDGSAGSRGSAPPPPEKIVVVSVEIRNECSDKVEYCVDSGGSTLNTSLGGNSSTSSSLGPGTKIQLKKDNRCGQTLFTVPESKDRQKVFLCQR